MIILWDLRLYSTAYKSRGVGVYTNALTNAFLQQKYDCRIIILGQKESLPKHLIRSDILIVEYKPSGWKKDLFQISFICRKYAVDIVHYWISLGPLHSIGMGFLNNCKVIATIYDAGVELWDLPHCFAIKKSWYYNIQKKLLKNAMAITTISNASAHDISTILRRVVPSGVFYPPMGHTRFQSTKKEPFFIALGGSLHKNLVKIINGFLLVNNGQIKLKIFGFISDDEHLPPNLPKSISFHSMSSYDKNLKLASGLIFCSNYEGLGLPVIEAMRAGCPVIASSIPSVKEVAGDAVCYVNLLTPKNIANAIYKVYNDTTKYTEFSTQQYKKYCLIADKSAPKLVGLYDFLNS